MKLPRDVSGARLVKALRILGYELKRQHGSHMRVVTTLNGEHHETVPNHDPIKPGSLSCILKNIAAHHGATLEQLVRDLKL